MKKRKKHIEKISRKIAKSMHESKLASEDKIESRNAKVFLKSLAYNRNTMNKKGTDISKYCGTVKFNEDALVIQKRLRNEWK